MVSLSGPERKKALLRIGKLADSRLKGTRTSEVEIAQELGFGSIEAMHLELKRLGVPDWMIGVEEPKAESNKRKARSAGKGVDLPRAVGAEHIFREDLDVLNRYLAELPFVEEFLQGKLFMWFSSSPNKGYGNRSLEGSRELVAEASIWTIVLSEEEDIQHYYKRAEEGTTPTLSVSEEGDFKRLREMAEAERGPLMVLVSEENLEAYRKGAEAAGIPASALVNELCLKDIQQREKYMQWYKERTGLDPRGNCSEAPTSSRYTLGCKRRPWDGLVYLIAMHALMNESVDPLIEALHPNPDEMDREEYHNLYREKHRYVTVLKTAAKQIAKTVRGVRVQPGRDDEEASPEEMWVAFNLIGPLDELGCSDEEIYRDLKKNLLDEEDRFFGVECRVPDIKRLRELFL